MEATEGQTIKCKAAVCMAAKEVMEIRDVEVGAPRKGEVRIKILYTGVCHTDEYTRSGADPEGLFPTILGHEGGGIVESIGEGVKSVKVGDKVIPLYVPQCRDCTMCNSTRTNLCSVIRTTQGTGVMPDGTSRFTLDGVDLNHFMGCSTFSQYTVLPEISVAVINKEAPLDKVCLLGCGITTGLGAVANTLKVESDATILVMGCGGVGLAAIMEAKRRNCKRIFAVDINDSKFALAKEFGATDCVNPMALDGKTLPEVIYEMTDGEGVDYSIECVGHPATMRQALQCTKPNGGCSCIIGVAAAGQCIEMHAEDLMGREWTGSAFGGTKGRDQLPEYVDEYLEGGLKVDEFITHNFGLKDINKAFDAMHAGDCIRAVIDMFADE